MKVLPITSIDNALRVYYMYPEIGNAQIRELFGDIAASTCKKYKKLAQEVQTEESILTSQLYTVNTKAAFKAWGIDVEDLEARRKKLKALGLAA